MTHGVFPRDIINAAQCAEEATTIPTSTTLWQWAIESAWGQHVIGRFNYFGIKFNNKINPRKVSELTTEYINGKWIREIQEFQDYVSLDEAFKAHGNLIARGAPYRTAMELLRMGEYTRFTLEFSHHYATSPNYGHVGLLMVARYDLGQYDTTKYTDYPKLQPARSQIASAALSS